MVDKKKVTDLRPFIQAREDEKVRHEPVPQLAQAMLIWLCDNAADKSLEEQLAAMNLASITIQRNVASKLGSATATLLANKAYQLSMQYRPRFED